MICHPDFAKILFSLCLKAYPRHFLWIVNTQPPHCPGSRLGREGVGRGQGGARECFLSSGAIVPGRLVSSAPRHSGPSPPAVVRCGPVFRFRPASSPGPGGGGVSLQTGRVRRPVILGPFYVGLWPPAWVRGALRPVRPGPGGFFF